jgi:hypothetical protein
VRSKGELCRCSAALIKEYMYCHVYMWGNAQEAGPSKDSPHRTTSLREYTCSLFCAIFKFVKLFALTTFAVHLNCHGGGSTLRHADQIADDRRLRCARKDCVRLSLCLGLFLPLFDLVCLDFMVVQGQSVCSRSQR